MTHPARGEGAVGQGAPLAVGGLLPLSTIDWPGRLSAVVFCQGCAWSCPYCQNAALRPLGPGDRPWSQVADWLETRRGLLEAVVFSGGEPLLQPGLAEAMTQARAMGFELGLHTSGMAPAALERVLPLCRWVGFDLKAPRGLYGRITGAAASAEAAWASLGLLRRSGAAFELRTTWHPQVLTETDLLELAGELRHGLADGAHEAGSVPWVIQAFQPEGCDNAALAEAGRARAPAPLAEALRAALGAAASLVVRQ